MPEEEEEVALQVKTLDGVSYALQQSPGVPMFKTVASIAVYVLALPVALPLGLLWFVAMATPLRGTLISFIIPRIMAQTDKEFEKEREVLLKNVKGKVLDVGSGGGAYLKYFRNSDHVVAVEPVVEMHPYIREAGVGLKELAIRNSLDDVLAEFPQASFDWVILGNVLCEVPDIKQVLDQVDVLLKPGGHVYFSEHVACPSGSWSRWYQDMVNPCWRHVSGGCNCNRESVRILKEHRWDVIEFTYTHLKVCLGPFVLGLAMKRSEKS